jgi:hypothetical protein
MHSRSEFNCPFDFITVKKETVATFLATDKDETVTIYWFDYDDSLGPEITADIRSLGTRLKVGGFAFVTICAQPSGVLEKQRPQERLDYLQEYLGDFSIGLTLDDMENSAYPTTVYKVLMAAFRYAFAARADGTFRPLFQVLYRDTTQMVTVGGCFCSRDAVATVVQRIRADLPFLFRKRPYKIQNLNLTEREKALFDIAVTKEQPDSEQTKSLLALGFKKRDFDAYRDLIRFLPRYHESII